VSVRSYSDLWLVASLLAAGTIWGVLVGKFGEGMMNGVVTLAAIGCGGRSSIVAAVEGRVVVCVVCVVWWLVQGTRLLCLPGA